MPRGGDKSLPDSTLPTRNCALLPSPTRGKGGRTSELYFMMRSKREVLQEYFGVSTVKEVRGVQLHRLRHEFDTQPPLDQWISMKLPWAAPVHPPLPSIQQINEAMETNRLRGNMSATCRWGECVIKCNFSFSLIQVNEPKINTRFTGSH